MALPVLNNPTYELVLPSSGKKVKYRPFLVKEQKILMMAQESKNDDEIANAMSNLIQSCTFGKIDVETSPMFDFEYIFLMLRSKSVGNTIELNLEHHCGQTNKVEIDVDDIQVVFSDDHTDKIQLSDEIGIKMKYPNISNTDMFTDANDVDKVFQVMETCIDYVYDEEKVYDEFTKRELRSFIESMNKDQLEKIMDFFNTMPSLEHEVEYTCTNCGEVQKYVLKGISDFFM